MGGYYRQLSASSLGECWLISVQVMCAAKPQREKLLVEFRLYGVGMGDKGPHGDMVTLSCDPVASSVLLCRKRLFVQSSMSV